MQDSMVPVYTTTLIGRTRETAEILELLNQEAAQLVTLTGTSGTGKTRLSLEVLTALTNQGQQVVFVPLAAITKAELVLPTLAQQLGIREHASISLNEQIIYQLQTESIVIILDNFEQLLPVAQDLELLIKAIPTLKILVTSQVPLNIEQETVYTIPGLQVPIAIPPAPAEALTYAAVQLFVQRIQRVQPNFHLDKANIEPVVEICQMLEGLPLAIEIVAAHSGVLLPRDLRLLVKQHLMLYRFRSKHGSGRQRIILPMVEWSLLRLPEDGQDLFNHLGIFQGGWMFDALRAIMPNMADLHSVLELLADRHLILKQASGDNEIRYMMLDAIQDFATTRFRSLEYEERKLIIQRHISFMQSLTHNARTEIAKHVNQQHWTQRLDQEMPNIRFLLDWALTNDPAQAVDLSRNLGSFWNSSGYWKEGVDWYSKIDAVADPEPSIYADMLMYYVTLLWSLSHYDQAYKIGKIGIAAAQEAGDRLAECRITSNIGLIFIDRQDYDQAKVYLEQSLQIAQSINSIPFQSSNLSNLAVIDSILGNYDAALVRYQAGYEVAQAAGEKLGMLAVLCNIGYLHILLGQPEQALEPLTEVIEGAQIIQLKILHALGLAYKAQALLLCEHSEGYSLMQEGIQILHELGGVIYVCLILDSVAGFLEQHRDLKSAGFVVGAVDQLRAEINVPRNSKHDLPNRIFDELIARVEDFPDFQAAREEGRNWSREDVVAFVLQELRVLQDAKT